MAVQSGWDTVFAEPILWSRNKTLQKCWDHIKYTIVVAAGIMVLLWWVQGHRYLYNILYGPLVLSEQEILDTRPENLWKQYIQVHHGTALDLITTEVVCDRPGIRMCKPMVFKFKKHATHDKNINQLVVKRPLPLNHQTYSLRHPINFNIMPVRKLMDIIQTIGMEKSVIPGMEKSELVSIITRAYDSNPKVFNQATESHVLVGFLTEFGVFRVYMKLQYMDLILDTTVPYVYISTPIFCALLYVYFIIKIAYYTFKISQTLASSGILTSFASTEFQKQILEPLRQIVQAERLQVNTSVYESAALKLQEEILSDDVSTIVNKEYFRLFVTNRHVIYLRNDIVDVISVSTIDDIMVQSGTCDVVLSSHELRTIRMSSAQAGRMRNALSSMCARFRQLEEERRARRQQKEEERQRRLQEQEARRRRLQEEEARRRRLQEQEARLRQQQEEEARWRWLQEQEARLRQQQEEEERRRRLQAAELEARQRRQEEEEMIFNEQAAILVHDANERPATEEAVREMRQNTCELNEDSEENCAICQEDMKTGERVMKFSCPAKHQFHEGCLLEWLERGSSCPMCRHQVSHWSRIRHIMGLVFL